MHGFRNLSLPTVAFLDKEAGNQQRKSTILKVATSRHRVLNESTHQENGNQQPVQRGIYHVFGRAQIRE